MKIEAITKNPLTLLSAIKKAIKDNELKTWVITKSTKDEELFTHSPDQWVDKALIRPVLSTGKLTFEITGWNSKLPDEATKGYYAGRFTEVLSVHFAGYFDHLETFTK